MCAPAALCRAANDSVLSFSDEIDDIVTVACGSFVIMAHGYSSQPIADRSSFWIRCAQRNIMPAEIEETMRRWRCRDNGTVDRDRLAEPRLYAGPAAQHRGVALAL